MCSSVLSWRPQLLLIEIVEPVSDLMMAALMLDATQPNPHECTYVNNPKNPEPEGSCTYSKNQEPSSGSHSTYVPNDAGTGPNPPTSHNNNYFAKYCKLIAKYCKNIV